LGVGEILMFFRLPKLRVRKIEKFSFNSPQLQLGVYEYYEMALAQNLKNCF
jgi:hypothetical protein